MYNTLQFIRDDDDEYYFRATLKLIKLVQKQFNQSARFGIELKVNQIINRYNL